MAGSFRAVLARCGKELHHQRWRKPLAVFLAALIVLSTTVSPIAATAGSSAQLTDAGNTATQPVDGSNGAELTPRAQLVDASEQIETVDPPTKHRKPHVRRAKERVSEAADYYSAPVYPRNRRAFIAGAQGTRALRFAVSRGDSFSADRAEKLVSASDDVRGALRKSIEWKANETRRSIENRRDGLTDAQYDRVTNVYSQIRRNLDRARDVRGRDGEITGARDARKRILANGRAISKFKSAWTRLDALERALDNYDAPANTNDTDGDGIVDSREEMLGTNVTDPDSDGDGINDSVETAGGFPIDTDGDGTIDALDEDSDGDGVPDSREGTKDTDGNGVPNFRDTDDDGDGIPTAVEVEDGKEFSHDVDFDGTVNWLDADADGDGTPDGVEGTTDSDDDGMPDYLDNDRDNDGLPDYYERNVTGTDPADNDSDSSVTDVNESDDGVIDGMEDYDGDTLGAYREYAIGTDPFDADTDGDGLSDGFEDRHQGFDPLDPDTDGDGVSDGASDLDGDGLTNAREAELGSAIDSNDTDDDGLSDAREVELGTDPVAVDTDDDGLPDAEELELGTDPTDPDSDGDGVRDGNESFTTTTGNESVEATVDVTGPGNVSEGVTVRQSNASVLDTETVENASVSETVSLRSEREFERANVTLGYDDGQVDDSSDVVVARYNRTTQTYDLLDTAVDESNGTVSAETKHFSEFTAVSTTTLSDQFAGEPNSSSVLLDRDNFSAPRSDCEGVCNTTGDAVVIGPTQPETDSDSSKATTSSVGALSVASAETRTATPTAEKTTSDRLRSKNDSRRTATETAGTAVTAEGNLSDPVTGQSVSAVTYDNGTSVLRYENGTEVRQNSGSGSFGIQAASASSSDAFETIQTHSDVTAVVIDATVDYARPTSPDSDDSWSASFVAGGKTVFETSNEAVEDKTIDDVVVPVSGGESIDLELQASSGAAIRLDSYSYRFAVDDDDDDDSGSVNTPRQEDLCDPVDGIQDVECPPSSTSVVEVPIDGHVEELTIEGSGRAVAVKNSEARVTVSGPVDETLVSTSSNGTVEIDETFTDVGTDGETTTLQIEAETTGLAGLRIDDLQITRDTDGDGVEDFVERGFRTGTGEVLRTNASDPDTDDDGIPDGEEIGELAERTQTVTIDGEQRKITQTYWKLASDPTAVDSDGDGLTDAEEREGWRAALATSPEQGNEFAEAREDDATNPVSVLDRPTVTSDPLYADTDDDGLSDLTEYRLKLDPADEDSDGDGIPDGAERAGSTEAAIHDHSAPAVQVRSIRTGDAARTSYNVTLRLADPSGLGKTRFYKKGEVQAAIAGQGDTEWGYDYVEFTVERDTLEKIQVGAAGFVTGASVDIETRDVHDNSKRKTFTGPDSFAQAARVIEQAPIDLGKREAIVAMSFSSGFGTVIGETLLQLKRLVENPAKILEDFKKLAEFLANNPEAITKLPQLMVQQIQDKQDTRNPFQEGESARTTFKAGWYVGYGSGTVAKEAASSGAGSAATRILGKSSKFRTAMKGVKSAESKLKAGVSTRTMARAQQVRKALPDNDKIDTARLGKKLSDMSPATRQRVVDQMGSLKRSTRNYIAETDVEAPGAKTAKLIEVTGSGGKRALRALADGNRRAADALLRMADDAATQRAMVRAWENGDVSTKELATALRRYNELDASERADFREVHAAAGDDAVAFASRTDSDTFESVFARCGPGRVPSIGGASSLQSDRYHSVEAPSALLAQGSGDCPADGLSDSERKDYQEAIVAADKVSSGPITDADELQDVLADLNSRDGFDDLDNVVGSMSGDKKGFKGVAGEAHIGQALDDRSGIDAGDGDIELEKDISAAEIEDEYGPAVAQKVQNSKKFKNVDASADGSSSDVDIKANTDVEVNGRTLQNPAIESKNLYPTSSNYLRIDSWDSLKKKLRTHAAAGEDELVVVMDQDYIDAEADRLDGGSDLHSREVLGNKLEEDIETELSNELGVSRDVTVEVTSYSDL
ncbi:hypothetical protein [Halomicrobium salinisoli]|uniref:hypothetical protein n=1 Tax=Halomicrobium salinisoli TaxID=2878391 RepID=UPI001CF042D5|nr:hypothetical protein [Halomicrobium salinisoli]